MATLAQVFDSFFSHVKFNKQLAKQIYGYRIGYVNNNKEHLQFFGSNLLGVHVVRFKDSDVLRFFELLDVDYYALTNEVRSKVTTIDHSFKISGDILNLTIMYTIHKFLTSGVIGDNDRHRAAYDLALIFFYRCIAAIMSDWFKYPADPKIAQAAYANLSYKYLIKKEGTWHAVMDYRAKALTDKHELHYKELVSFRNDQAIVYAINDSQGRIRDLLKNYYSEFSKVHSSGTSIATTSSTFLDAEGEETIKEKIRSTESYVNYIKNIILDRHSFVKDDLVGVIARINTNSSFRMIKSVLLWLSDNYNHTKHHKEIDEFLDLTIVHSMHMLQEHSTLISRRDYPTMLHTLKNLYLSTRSTDQDLIRIRELGEKLIRNSQNVRLGDSLVLATRTSIILYLTLRTLIGMKH